MSRDWGNCTDSTTYCRKVTMAIPPPSCASLRLSPPPLPQVDISVVLSKDVNRFLRLYRLLFVLVFIHSHFSCLSRSVCQMGVWRDVVLVEIRHIKHTSECARHSDFYLLHTLVLTPFLSGVGWPLRVTIVSWYCFVYLGTWNSPVAMYYTRWELALTILFSHGPFSNKYRHLH